MEPAHPISRTITISLLIRLSQLTPPCLSPITIMRSPYLNISLGHRRAMTRTMPPANPIRSMQYNLLTNVLKLPTTPTTVRRSHRNPLHSQALTTPEEIHLGLFHRHHLQRFSNQKGLTGFPISPSF